MEAKLLSREMGNARAKVGWPTLPRGPAVAGFRPAQEAHCGATGNVSCRIAAQVLRTRTGSGRPIVAPAFIGACVPPLRRGGVLNSGVRFKTTTRARRGSSGHVFARGFHLLMHAASIRRLPL